MMRWEGSKSFLGALTYLQRRYPGFELCESRKDIFSHLHNHKVFKPGDRTTEFIAFKFCVTI